MSWTLCLSGSAILDAGASANTACQTGASFDNWSDQVEGRICTECHTDFVNNFATYPTQVQHCLNDVASAMVAKKIVAYDRSTYSDAREAETILDTLDERETKGLAFLKDKTNHKLSA